MKLSDVNVFTYNGHIFIGRLNKRNNVKSNKIDITKAILKFIVDTFLSDPDSFYHFQSNGEHFRIKCNKLSAEEVLNININKKIKSEKAIRSFTSLILPFVKQLL